MADRTSAYLFGEIFKYLARQTPQSEDTIELAKAQNLLRKAGFKVLKK